MVTDDERREVARRLRSVAREVLRSGFVEDMRHVKMAVFEDADRYRPNGTLDRLADLIEPSIPADPGEAGLACVDAFIREHTEKPVDRDALLALADELEEDACWEVQTPGDTSGAWRLKDTCDRIREACGEVVR